MSKQALYDWCKENKPLLAYSLYDAPDVKALRVLNRATGLNIQPNAELQSSCALFLDALKRKQREDEKEVTCALHLAEQFGFGSGTTKDALDAYRDCMVTGTGMYAISPDARVSGAMLPGIRDDRFTRAEIDDARVVATKAEHARIMAKLEECRPTEQPYSRRDWALEERGKKDLWAKIMKALGQPVKEGE